MEIWSLLAGNLGFDKEFFVLQGVEFQGFFSLLMR